MFYDDLSPYRYSAQPTGLPGVFNVGWLSSRVPISQGDVAAAVKQKLARLSDPPVILYRGSHLCDFCQQFYGNGEIWIPGDDGRVYASPSMLVHYIEKHNYLPPESFIEALQSADAALTETDCYARIAAHRTKLDTAPTPEDILVPFYSVKIFWKLSDFPDLTAFVKFIDKNLWGISHYEVNDIGYCVYTECEKPDQKLRELVSKLQRRKPTPFQCMSKLLYLGGEEQVYPAPIIEKPPNKVSGWWRRLRGL